MTSTSPITVSQSINIINLAYNAYIVITTMIIANKVLFIQVFLTDDVFLYSNSACDTTNHRILYRDRIILSELYFLIKFSPFCRKLIADILSDKLSTILDQRIRLPLLESKNFLIYLTYVLFIFSGGEDWLFVLLAIKSIHNAKIWD